MQAENKTKQEIRKRARSFRYAWQGIVVSFRSEANLKIHVFIAALVIICGFLFKISVQEWLICILCFGLVISMELMNTVVETLVDYISTEEHPLAGKAKDIAAGAVLVSAVFAALAGLMIFVPKAWILIMN